MRFRTALLLGFSVLGTTWAQDKRLPDYPPDEAPMDPRVYGVGRVYHPDAICNFQVNNNRQKWAWHFSNAQSLPGDCNLASIVSQAEQDEVVALLGSTFAWFRIGAKRVSPSSTAFEWVDGAPWGYTNWRSWAPSDPGSGRDYVDISIPELNREWGTWRDIFNSPAVYKCCVRCIDDQPAGTTDSGCTESKPDCKDEGGGLDCHPYDGPIKKKLSRRRVLLTTATLAEPTDKLYQEHLNACGGFDYAVELYVDPDSHLYAIGYPKEAAAVAAGCPMVATHVVLATEVTPAHKELLGWEDSKQGLSMFAKEARLPMGTFKLVELEHAYQEAKVDTTGGGIYDVVTNNCGSYMASLASKLGVPVDSHVTTFVARRLLEHSASSLAKQIRNSANYFDLFEHRGLRGPENPSDEELVTMLVEDGARKVQS